MAKCDILDEFGQMELPVPNGKQIKKNYVGENLANYDSILMLSHFKGHGMGGFGGMNLNNIMQEAKKMQADMEKSQAELAEKEFEATAGGGAVHVKVSGEKKLKEIKIQKDVVDPDDVEMLQDLILTSINEALRQVDEAQAAQLGKYNIPGLM